jgi:hypothetical protein
LDSGLVFDCFIQPIAMLRMFVQGDMINFVLDSNGFVGEAWLDDG